MQENGEKPHYDQISEREEIAKKFSQGAPHFFFISLYRVHDNVRARF